MYNMISGDLPYPEGDQGLDFKTDQWLIPVKPQGGPQTWELFVVSRVPHTVVGPMTYTFTVDSKVESELHGLFEQEKNTLRIGDGWVNVINVTDLPHGTIIHPDTTNSPNEFNGTVILHKWEVLRNGAPVDLGSQNVTRAPQLFLPIPDGEICGTSYSIRVKSYIFAGPLYGAEDEVDFESASDFSEPITLAAWKMPSFNLVAPPAGTNIYIDKQFPVQQPSTMESCGCPIPGLPPSSLSNVNVSTVDNQIVMGIHNYWVYDTQGEVSLPISLLQQVFACMPAESWNMDTRLLPVGNTTLNGEYTDSRGFFAQSGSFTLKTRYQGGMEMSFCPGMAGATVVMQPAPGSQAEFPEEKTVQVPADLMLPFRFYRMDQADQQVLISITKDGFEPFPSDLYKQEDPSLQIQGGKASYTVPMGTTLTPAVFCLKALPITISGRVNNPCGLTSREFGVPYPTLYLKSDGLDEVKTVVADFDGKFTFSFRPKDGDPHDYKLWAKLPGYDKGKVIKLSALSAGNELALSDDDSPSLCPVEDNDECDNCSSPNPLNTATGERSLHVTDLRVPGKSGLDFNFTRHYLGEVPVDDGPLGFGWSHNWDVYMVAQRGGSLAVHFSDGLFHRFDPDPDHPGQFKAKNGFFYRLELNNQCYELVDRAGTRWHFDQTLHLEHVMDRFGNTIELGYDAQARLSSVKDTGNRTYAFTYYPGSSKRIASFTDPGPNGTLRSTSFSYGSADGATVNADGSGDLIRVDGPGAGGGYHARYSYDGDHLIAGKLDVRQPKGYRNVRYTYDGFWRNTAIIRRDDAGADAGTAYSAVYDQGSGKDTVFTRDGYAHVDLYDSHRRWSGQVVGSDPNGLNKNQRTWDGGNQGLASMRDLRGNLQSYAYYQPGDPGYVGENRGELKQSVDALGVKTDLSYDSYGLGVVTAKTVFDPISGVTHHYSANVDSQGRVTHSDQDGRTIDYEYSPSGFGQWTKMTDSDGGIVGREFDPSSGLLKRQSNPRDGLATSYAYDGLGRIHTALNEASGILTTYSYDGEGNVSRMDYSDGWGSSAVVSTFDPASRLTIRIDENSKSFTYVYSQDGKDNLKEEDGPSGSYVRTLGYNNENLLGSETLTGPDGLGGTFTQNTSYQYEQAGCNCANQGALRFIYQSGALVNNSTATLTTEYRYDKDGNRTDIFDPKGNQTHMVIDAQNRVSSVTTGYGTADARQVSYGIDGFGNRHTLTDGKTQITTFNYDAKNQLSSEVPAEGPSIGYGYTPAGKLNSKTDRNGRSWSATYADSGRMLSESFQDENNGGQSHAMSYGSIGKSTDQLLKIVEPTGSEAFSYGHRGRLSTQDYPERNRQLIFSHDLAGNLTALNIKDTLNNTQKTSSYVPDDLNRVQSYSDFAGNRFDYFYDAASHLRKVKIWGRNLITPLATGRMTYDQAGRMTKLEYRKGDNGILISKIDYVLDANGNRTARNSIATQSSFTYNALNELKTDSNSADIRGNLSFLYDGAGNRTQQGFGPQLQTYGYGNQLNRLSTATSGPEGNFSFTSDFEGNRTKKSVLNADLNPETNGDTSYAWDSKQRLKKVTLPDGTIVNYTYDSQNRLVTKSKGSETRTYIYGSGFQLIEETLNGQRLALFGWGADGLASRTDANGHTLFYLKDGLGSVMAIIDEKANIVQSYEYSAFGECLSGKDAVNAFRFVGAFGGQTDDDTGLVYFWNRWYDPKVGRWVSEDPIRQEGGLNLFEYVGNNPTIALDPSGLLADGSLSLDDISIDEALAHYAYGGGKTLILPLAAVSFTNGRPRDFRSVKKYLAAKKDISVKISDEKVVNGTGKWEYILGPFTLSLEGQLDISRSCWSFSGNYPNGYDYYDFDSKPWGVRTKTNELITRIIGGTVKGLGYDIFLNGPVPVSDGGSLP